MQATVKEVIQETHNVKTLALDLDEPLEYKTAQFIMLGVKGSVKKAYSIGNLSTPNKIRVTFRVYPGGMLTPKLDKLKVGDKVEFTGPHGKFLYEKGKTTLIGAGTGITPLHGILHCALRDKQEITVYYSDRTELDLIYKDELKQLEKEGKIDLHLFITREDSKKYNSGRINTEDLSKLKKDGNFYICGPPSFVPAIIKELMDLGIKDEQIKREMF